MLTGHAPGWKGESDTRRPAGASTIAPGAIGAMVACVSEPLHETDHFVDDVVASPTLLLQRIGPPLVALLLLFVGGGVGYFLIGLAFERDWPLLSCMWMSVISLTTVGYGEVFPLDFPMARLYTMALLIVGMGVTVWAMSSVTAFFVEGHLGFFFRERALEKQIEKLQGHTIVCGLSATSEHVLEEHQRLGQAAVLVDARHELVPTMREQRPTLPVVVGDPSHNDVLVRAGIHRAKTLVACLNDDRDNIFLVITARQLSADVDIIVKCDDQQSVTKFKAAGATHVINPTFIGGMRIASQALRPTTVAFLDQMLRGGNQGAGEARVSEVVVQAGAPVCGQTIAAAGLVKRSGLPVVAMKPASGGAFVYGPGDDTVLEAGMTLIVVGEVARLKHYEERCRAR